MTDTKPGRVWLIPAAMACLFALIFFRFWNHSIIFRDSFMYFAPDKFLIAQALRSGTIYAWDPWEFAGMPFAADVQAGWFYPLNLIYLVLPFEPAHRLFILAHYPLAAIFMYWFARGRELTKDSAVLAGLAYALSGYLVSQHANVAFLIGPALAPLALYFLLRADRGPLAWATLAGAVLALQVLAGEPQSAAITAGLMIVVSLALIFSSARRGRPALALTIAGISSLALSAIQLLPTLEMISQSVRRSGYSLDLATEFSFHPARLLELIFPSPFGTPAPEYHFWGKFSLEPSLQSFNLVPWAYTNYLGLPLLTLAIIGVLMSRRRWKNLVAAAMAVFLLIAFGRHTPIYGWLYQLGPFFKVFRYPEKYLAWFTAASALAAGLGLERIEDWRQERPILLARAALIYLAAMIALAVLAALILPGVLNKYSGLPGGGPELRIARSELFGKGAQWLAINLAAGTVMFLMARSLLSWKRGVVLFLFILILDWWLANVSTMPTGPTDIYKFRPLAAKAISAQGRPALGQFRIFRAPMEFRDLNDALVQRFDYFERQCIWERSTLVRNLNAMEGFEDIIGYYSSQLGEGDELLRTQLNPRTLMLYNVEYVISAFGANPGPELKTETILSDRENDLTVTRLREAWPRAYWVPGAKRAKDEQEAMALMKAVDLKKSVIITSAENLEPGAADQELVPARIARYEPDRVEIKVQAPAAGWLALLDRFYPGWQASVDGQPATIYKANVFVRALRLEAGEHQVIFSFHSRTLRWGAVISSLALLAALAWWGITLRKKQAINIFRSKP